MPGKVAPAEVTWADSLKGGGMVSKYLEGWTKSLGLPTGRGGPPTSAAMAQDGSSVPAALVEALAGETATDRTEDNAPAPAPAPAWKRWAVPLAIALVVFLVAWKALAWRPLFAVLAAAAVLLGTIFLRGK